MIDDSMMLLAWRGSDAANGDRITTPRATIVVLGAVPLIAWGLGVHAPPPAPYQPPAR
jgi:hypothetical protein